MPTALASIQIPEELRRVVLHMSGTLSFDADKIQTLTRISKRTIKAILDNNAAVAGSSSGENRHDVQDSESVSHTKPLSFNDIVVSPELTLVFTSYFNHIISCLLEIA